MYKRSLATVLERYSKIYRVISIMGPRQSGKTTIARTLFPHLPYVSFESSTQRLLFEEDPDAFLEKYKTGAIFDEAQYVPELFSRLQLIVDKSPEKGRFVLTGSQNFLLNEKITQSLAGRVGITTLLPLSLHELGTPSDTNTAICQGGYPELHTSHMTSEEFFLSYVSTYVERDVRQIIHVENLLSFQKFMKLCAGRIGQLVNLESLANDCDISPTTVRRWFSILESSYIIFFLQPFHKNFSKRLIKMPKLYFNDTGLACHLLGITTPEQVESHYLKGGLYENLVILEILKGRLNRAKTPGLYFWRDSTGHEIDLIGEWDATIKAIAIKAGSTFKAEFIKNVSYFCELSKNENPPTIPVQPYLIYKGDYDGTFLGTKLVPFSQIDSIFNT